MIVPMYAGLPLIRVEKGNKVQFDIGVKTYSLNTTASNSNYGVETRTNPSTTYIWAKSSPFTTNDPNSEADLTITGANVKKSTSTAYNKGVYINSAKERIQIEGIRDNCCIWLKWSTSNKNGGGVVTIPNQVAVISEG